MPTTRAALIRRVAAGRTDRILDLLAAGMPPDASGADGVAVLAWCAYYGDVTAVRTLVAAGAPLALLGDDFGLNAAAFHGHWRLCQFLLEQGAPVGGAKRVSGETPLHAALVSEDRVRHDAVVDVLLAAGADPNAATVPGVETGDFMRDARTRGETPLHRAAAFAGVAAIDRLLAAGADRERRDAAGDTPLSWASWYRRPPRRSAWAKPTS